MNRSIDRSEPSAGTSQPPAGRRERSADQPDDQLTPVRERLEIDRESVERGLVALVLTVVELLRQLMERQAIRRIDQGDLTDEQIERIGATLMALDDRMAQLREHFGLTPEDVNIDLGPLGSLLPPAERGA